MRIFTCTSWILGATLLTVACNKELPRHEPSTAAGAESSAPAPEAAPPAQTDAAVAPVQSVPAGVPPAAGVIASTEGEKEGIRIDVTEFKRASGDTVNLKFNVVNGSSEQLSFNSLLDDAHEYFTAGGIHLVDPVNKRKYFVVRDAEKKCVCSRDISAIEPGKKAALWAKFPAPPPDVQRVSLVFPKFIPIDDVPLQ